MYKRLIQILISTLIVGAFIILFTPSVLAMEITVQSTNGNSFTLNVGPTETIQSIKNKIYNKIDIPVELQTLMFRDIALEDNLTIANYNIKKQSILQLVKHAHVYGDWKIAIAPTCITTGERQKDCSCGDVITETIQTTQMHTPSDWIAIKKASYGEEGKQIKQCTVCNKELETQVVAMLRKPTTPTASVSSNSNVALLETPSPQTGDTSLKRWITAIACIAGFSLLVSVLLRHSKDEEPKK